METTDGATAMEIVAFVRNKYSRVGRILFITEPHMPAYNNFC
jgi:hypothetical protein